MTGETSLQNSLTFLLVNLHRQKGLNMHGYHIISIYIYIYIYINIYSTSQSTTVLIYHHSPTSGHLTVAVPALQSPPECTVIIFLAPPAQIDMAYKVQIPSWRGWWCHGRETQAEPQEKGDEGETGRCGGCKSIAFKCLACSCHSLMRSPG